MELKLSNYESSLGSELHCPGCGQTNLHHGRVEVFDCGEDAKTGLRVNIMNEKATIDNSLEGNPSPRRHGLRIHFSCEQCPAESVLSLVQHKGTTYIQIK